MNVGRAIVAERELRGLEVVLAQLGDSMGPDLIVGRIEGPLRFDALREACFRLQQRHPSLRSAIVWPEGGVRKRARLRAHAPDRHALDVREIDGAAVRWQDAAQQQSRHRFDLRHGFLLRVVWVRAPGGSGGHLIICSHHAIVDGTSLMRLLHQLLEATVAVQQALEEGAPSAEAAAPAYRPSPRCRCRRRSTRTCASA
jgi:hypothetical protein